MRQFRPVHLAALLIVLALYIAVRCWGLTSSCLWFDEIFSVHAAEHSWNELFSFVALDLIHPPLFYVLLKLWIGVGADGLLWLRLLAVVFAVIAVFPFFALCRELNLAFWTRILALFFLGVNGCLIKYAQEVRMYSLLFCLSLFSMWLFARFFIKGMSFIALVIINLLMVYTHYFGWFIVLAEVSAILLFQRIKWREVVGMFAIVVAGFLPWVYAVWNAVHSGSALGQNIGWMTRPGPLQVAQFILDLVEPFYYQASSIDPASVYRVSIPILLISIVSFAFYFTRWKARPDDEKQVGYFVLLFTGVPVSIACVMSWLLPYSIWGTRHLIVVFAPFSILLAIAIINMPMQAARTASVTLILLLSGLGFVGVAGAPVQTYSWCNWAPLGTRR